MKPGLPIILSCLILFVSGGGITCAQTLGGNSVFNFLELANTPQLTALGEALLDFASPDELSAWLRTPPAPQDEDATPEAE